MSQIDHSATTRRKKEKELSTPLNDNLIYGKTPPQATELEKGILGAILVERDAIEKAAEIINPQSFYLETHQNIYTACLMLNQRGTPVDLLTVSNELTKMGKLEQIGGAYYLARLTNDIISAANIEAHCKIIQQKYIRRELIRVSGSIMNSAYQEGNDEFDIMEDAEKAILEIGEKNNDSAIMDMNFALMESIKKIEYWRSLDGTLTGVPSGFPDLDRATRGWQGGDLIILAARPSIGKTAFALNLILNAALHDSKPVPVGVWSLEMAVTSLVIRMISAKSSVWMHKIQTGKLSEQDIKQIYDKAVQELSGGKIYFDEGSDITISSFRSKARRMKKKFNIGMIVVDYLQLMSGDNKGNREQEISQISRSLKKLAMELDIPIIALSQLSRDIEKRTGANKRPQLSDLRESGAIEQDADMVIFLWGPSDEEVSADRSLEGKRYLRIAKQRNGTLAKIDLDFKNEIQLFTAIEQSFPTLKPVQLDLMAPRDFTQPAKSDEDDLPF